MHNHYDNSQSDNSSTHYGNSCNITRHNYGPLSPVGGVANANFGSNYGNLTQVSHPFTCNPLQVLHSPPQHNIFPHPSSPERYSAFRAAQRTLPQDGCRLPEEPLGTSNHRKVHGQIYISRGEKAVSSRRHHERFKSYRRGFYHDSVGEDSEGSESEGEAKHKRLKEERKNERKSKRWTKHWNDRLLDFCTSLLSGVCVNMLD
ncbi:hypothetical protein NMY22_g1088 [Coprinellus aureogranulatus]|nr:hypothetical protein NMY22_g1088 [Coprinellus aureogranulatus]